jgi:AcrR family transcriptional regulator
MFVKGLKSYLMSRTRRVPTQSRSREKYEKLIETARELIGSKGNDSVSMREISKHSGVALASIYQYFPDKNAILYAIMERLFEQVRTELKQALEGCENIDDLINQVSQIVDYFHLMFKQDPVLSILWAGLQANPELVELDVKDSQRNAKLISEKICSMLELDNQQGIYEASLLIVHLIGPTTRLTLTLPEEQSKALIEEFKEIIRLRLSSLSSQ